MGFQMDERRLNLARRSSVGLPAPNHSTASASVATSFYTSGLAVGNSHGR
jgi:hypothetical protein